MTREAPSDTTTVEVIIPLKDMEAHVVGCLTPLLEQRRPGDVVTVVDDGSSDRTAEIAKDLGANVVTLPISRGPYFGRHLAACRSSAQDILFVDGRSKAKAGLLDSHRERLAQPGVALSCTDVAVIRGASLASRVASLQDMFSLQNYIGVAGRSDYFPTCNLGVLRSSYMSVGGFRAMRSGADADLCWRIQSAGLGRIECDPEIRMEWVPRDSLGDLMRQWYRYGRSGADLAALHQPTEPPSSQPRPPWFRLRRTVAHARNDPVATLCSVGLEFVLRVGALTRRLDREKPSTMYPLYGDFSEETGAAP